MWSCVPYLRAWHDRDGRGSVYVFSKKNGSWTEVQKLSPTKTEAHYGHSVAISDTMLAVKAPFDYINGFRGVVYLYKKDNDDKYEEIERLSTPEENGEQNDLSTSPQIVLLDDFVIVGAPAFKKVYTFRKTSTGGYQKTTELVASDAKSGSSFGAKIGGERTNVLVADCGDDSTYLFSYEDGVWKEKAKFDGCYASLSGNSILVLHSPFEFKSYRNQYGGKVSFYDLVCEPV